MYIRIDKTIMEQFPKKTYDEFVMNFFEYPDEPIKIPSIEEMVSALKTSPDNYYITYCAYCKTPGLLQAPKKRNPKEDPSPCGMCGEIDPIYKLFSTLNKVKLFCDISNEIKNLHPDNCAWLMHSRDIERILFGQCVISIATGCEIFFKEVYCVFMNEIFVRPDKDLYDYFKKRVENRFVNYVKISDDYKDDLGIDLKKIINSNNSDVLYLMFQIRHILVHNNGIIDKKFIENNKNIKILKERGLSYSKGDRYIISIDDLKEFEMNLMKLITNIQSEYHKIFLNVAIERYNQHP